MTAQEVPWEYIIPATFCLSILAAFGIQNIIEQVPKGWKSFLGFEIILIALLEIFFVAPTIVPIPTTRVTIPEHYYTLADEPDNLAVFDYPTRRAKTSMIPTEYFYYQSIHKKPIPYAIKDSWIDRKELWAHMTRNQQSGGRDIENQLSRFSTEEIQKTFEDLKSKGFGFFIVHKKLLEKGTVVEHKRLFNSIMGEPKYEDSEIIRYDL